MEVGSKVETVKADTSVHCNITMTPMASEKPGVAISKLTTSGIQADWGVNGPGGHLVFKLRGSDIVGTQNGFAMVDTAEDIGFLQAQELKKESKPLYMRGEVDIDATGKGRELRGNPLFIEFRQEALQAQYGFYCIVFPEHGISVGGGWKEKLSLKSIGKLKLIGKELLNGVSFIRQPDIFNNGARIGIFSLESPLMEKNMSADLDQSGRILEVSVPLIEGMVVGNVQFDAEKGLMIKSDAAAK